MKNHRVAVFALRSLCLLLAGQVVAGCIRDRGAECFDSYAFRVMAYSLVDGREIASEVGDVVLYVFDRNEQFFEEIETTVGSRVSVRVPMGETITVVAWGNLSGGNPKRPAPKTGAGIDDCIVQLTPQSRSAVTYAQPSGNLFRGSVTASKPDLKGGEKVIPLYQATGSMSITVRGLEPYIRTNGDFSVIVKETRSSIDFRGNLGGDKISYSPSGAFDAEGNYLIPQFSMLPSGADDRICIMLLYEDRLWQTVSSDSSGAPLVVEAGYNTRVEIDLGAKLSVKVSVVSWEDSEVGKEYKK